MNLSDLIIGRILPYLALAVGAGGLLVRLGFWMRIPAPFRLTLFPLPKRTSGRIARLGRELLLQTTLLHSAPRLWLGVWLFHLSLAAVLAGHVLGLSSPENPFRIFGIPDPVGGQLSTVLGSGAGFIMIATLGALLARRLLLSMSRRYCQWRSYFELLLLLSIAVTGQLLRLDHNIPLLVAISRYLAGLFERGTAPLPNEPLFLAHYLLVMVLLCYLPFSRLVHLIGFFLYRMLLLEPPIGSPRSPKPGQPSSVHAPEKATDSRDQP